MNQVGEVEVQDDRLTVRLTDGRKISVPLDWFPRLEAADDAQRRKWELIGDGEGIHWPEVDEDISVESLLRPEETISSRKIREQETGPRDSADHPHRRGGTLQGWDDTRIYLYFDEEDPLRPFSGYCVSHDPALMARLVEVCRRRMRELDLDDLPPRQGDLRPWPPAPEKS